MRITNDKNSLISASKPGLGNDWIGATAFEYEEAKNEGAWLLTNSVQDLSLNLIKILYNSETIHNLSNVDIQ